jgi:hypothetical protein
MNGGQTGLLPMAVLALCSFASGVLLPGFFLSARAAGDVFQGLPMGFGAQVPKVHRHKAFRKAQPELIAQSF